MAAYGKALDDWELPELQNAAKALTDLQTHPGWAVLKQLAEYRRDLILASCDPPHIHEQAAYASWHGQRSGIQQVLDAPGAVVYAAWRKEAEVAQRVRQEA